ncbi:hypothetical protein CC80DRAFT_591538 [Byssothecium circinans]|uniref:DUF967 domain protein n=1 Tax=Byssothecium circinans TaxID=147558 RepID=A0A6A5U178_9PLEO|nr:hypothetical protein CC80DRAFT_591538 [Byssothecium circinans]
MAALPEAPRDLETLAKQQDELILPHFTAEDAFNLGVSIRKHITTLYPTAPCVVNIAHANSDALLFHCTTAAGVQPDNDQWVARKRRTVKRWGQSSWYMGRKFDGDEEIFARKFVLGEQAGDYAIHGGAVPVRVKGVEGTVAVVVVSGLRQEDDHMVVVEGLRRLIGEAK